MSSDPDPAGAQWVWTTRWFVAALPKLAFPWTEAPEIYVSQNTALRLTDGKLLFPYQWCYLDRRLRKPYTEFNLESLSAVRVRSMLEVLGRLSQWVRFNASRPTTIASQFNYLSMFLAWVDGHEHQRRFEAVLIDAELALDALKLHHAYLRQMVLANQMTGSYAASRDQSAIRLLSELHDRVYLNDIEPLVNPHDGAGTRAPREELVGQWMSTLQAVFDSVDRLWSGLATDQPLQRGARHVIRVSATDDAQVVVLPLHYDLARLLDLACVAFAGLAIGDSGANLSQVARYEAPDDLQAQLAQPERVSLTHKVIKFRAGGVPVPVHLSATTLTRLRAYLRIREQLIALMGNGDIAPMFVQCQYADWVSPRKRSTPHGVKGLNQRLLQTLRTRVGAIGVVLPPITLQQLRSYKQQHVLRKHGIKVAADTMGHSIVTAIRAYSKAQEDVRRGDMGQFLSSLSATMIQATAENQEEQGVTRTAVGACKAHGQPAAADPQPQVTPDCRKTEGCFFCAQLRVHADEEDTRKLVSCRHVLVRLAPLQGSTGAADRVYTAVIDRVDALLSTIEQKAPDLYQRVWDDVHSHGNLSAYWAVKLQQLHLLGMLTPPA